jgi:hypothetical protein
MTKFFGVFFAFFLTMVCSHFYGLRDFLKNVTGKCLNRDFCKIEKIAGMGNPGNPKNLIKIQVQTSWDYDC